MNKKYYIYTFGCQMNVHDSEKIAGMLTGLGYSSAENDKDADLILFNTCTVRDHAHHKAISEIGRAVSKKKRRPDLMVGVCGCVAQEEKEHLFEIYPELDLVFGPDQISRLPELLMEKKALATDLVDDADGYRWLIDEDPIENRGGRVTAFVTIMKGCNNKCSFCIVPFVRGSEVSKPADDIIAEISSLARSGVREITLLGQNVNSYNGVIFSKELGMEISPFVGLIRRISKETDILRIRYTSPHPKDLGDDLIEEHANNPKLCCHMHLPLQAGSDNVLRAMKRSYNKKQFIEKTRRLKERVPSIEITTDIIVGFPGETESDFQDTLDVVRDVSFDGMFAFKYSPRPGTKAAEMKDDVPQRTKEERLARLLDLNAKIWKERADRLVGATQHVLVEGVSKKSADDPNTMQMSGRTFGNKIVNFAGNFDLVGHIVAVKITSAGQNSLKGERC